MLGYRSVTGGVAGVRRFGLCMSPAFLSVALACVGVMLALGGEGRGPHPGADGKAG